MDPELGWQHLQFRSPLQEVRRKPAGLKLGFDICERSVSWNLRRTGRGWLTATPCGMLLRGRYFSILGFHTFHTLPTRSGPGLRMRSPGIQPAGVASVPLLERTSWNA
jgi:hypothetical protein